MTQPLCLHPGSGLHRRRDATLAAVPREPLSNSGPLLNSGEFAQKTPSAPRHLINFGEFGQKPPSA